MNEWMNDDFINVWSKLTNSLVLHTRQLKKITKELKHNAEWYGVREGSPVEVYWAVR